MPVRDIIVIGASAGGVEALMMVTARLPPDLPAAVFIVNHVPAESNSRLPAILARGAHGPVVHAKDGEPIRYGHVYVAPPDHHLIVKEEHVHLSRGPRENGMRPASDTLFRSAASSCGSRVIGVVLSGMLNDGTAGLLAIKHCGGLAVVQDPDDAMYPQMPRSALANVEVDHCVPAAQMGALLARLAGQQVNGSLPIPKNVVIEAQIAEGAPINVATAGLAIPAGYSCPDCGGALNEMLDAAPLTRFRCRVGHAHTLASLAGQKVKALQEALWAALRTQRERVELYQRMADQARLQGYVTVAQKWTRKVEEAQAHAEVIDSVLKAPGGAATFEDDPELPDSPV